MSRKTPAAPGRDAILAAKGRIPPLPVPHVPRPRAAALLGSAVRTHRLVILAAGALTGKTTLLAELAGSSGIRCAGWYSVDEADVTAAMLLEGLVRATGGTAIGGDEAHLLGAVVAALDGANAGGVLILDDVHRAPAATEVVDRLLRYLPQAAQLVLSGWPGRLPAPPLVQWLDDRGQVAHIGAAELRLDEEERARFHATTGHTGGAWAVEYRPGGHPSAVEGLRRGVLPLLCPEERSVVDLLAVVPSATPELLGAVLRRPEAEVARRLAGLRAQTILVEQLDPSCYRLSEMAREAALCSMDAASTNATRRAAAAWLADHDPAQAAHLFALAGAIDEAAAAAGRVSWWEWTQRPALAQTLEELLPGAALHAATGLALVAAHRRLVEEGPNAVHAPLRRLRPREPVERMQRFLLLAHCCAARGRPWSLSRCMAGLEALVARPDGLSSVQDYAYGLLALGTARGLAGRYPEATDALRACLDVLVLDGGEGAGTASTRLAAYRTLAVVQRRLGHLADAERLYAEAEAQAHAAGTPYVQLELANNRAVLLQQRGAHAESADLLRTALASPWSAERSLRPLLQASLADALDALGDRTGAAAALRTALEGLPEPDVYGLRGHVRAARALLLAEGGHPVAAGIELAAGAPPEHPATLLARALLCNPLGTEACPALRRALAAAGTDIPLRVRAQAHLARVYALRDERQPARQWADKVAFDRSYPLTAREAAILGPRTRRIRRPRRPAPPAATARVVVRFFGPPILSLDERSLGSAWWAHSKGHELLWYALAHGARGFTRAEACADLFPEMDGEAAGRALRNVLYELRKMLLPHCGPAPLRAGSDGRLRLSPEELGSSPDVDTRTLEERLARLRAGDGAAAADLPVLLAGRYLAGIEADWTHPFRYYWEREAVHALDLAATHFERAGRAPQAVTCLQRELELCPDDTALVRRLMTVYAALGDVAGARATYLAHRRSLHDDLGVAPQAELLDLYEALAR